MRGSTPSRPLSFYRLPRQHHKHLKSTNMLERLNEEIKRRTHVVRIFRTPRAACGWPVRCASQRMRTGSRRTAPEHGLPPRAENGGAAQGGLSHPVDNAERVSQRRNHIRNQNHSHSAELNARNSARTGFAAGGQRAVEGGPLPGGSGVFGLSDCWPQIFRAGSRMCLGLTRPVFPDSG